MVFKVGSRGVSRSFALGAGVLLCLCAVAAPADEKAETKAIKAVYATHIKGFRNKDVKTMFSVYTSDCKISVQGIEYGLPQLKASFAQQVASIHSIKEYREDVTSLKFQGKKATAMIHVTFTGKAVDPRGITRDLSQNGDSEDTLIKTASGWKIQHSTQKEFHIFVDGKPVRPAAH